MLHSTHIQQRILQFPKPFKGRDRFQFTHFFRSRKKIHLLEIIDFTRELSTLINTGISITIALEIIANSHENPRMQKLIRTIKSDIESGQLLGNALKHHPAHFSPFFIQLVLIGEQSGTLEIQLKQAAHYLEKFLDLKNKLKKALTYPFCVILFTLFIMSGILTFILPQFQTLYQSFGSELPFLTRLIINLSNHLKYMVIFLLAFFTLSLPILHKLKKTSSRFAFLLDQLLLKTPIIGIMISQHLTARICNLLAVTYRSGLSFPKSLALLSLSIKNQVYSKALTQVQVQIKKGTPFHQAMANTHLFPKRVTQMIYIGEQSGALLSMLKKMGAYYEIQLIIDLSRSINY